MLIYIRLLPVLDRSENTGVIVERNMETLFCSQKPEFTLGSCVCWLS